MAAPLYLGLISGTSADGIDAALVRFEPEFKLIHAATTAYPAEIRERILALATANATVSLSALGELDVLAGECFAQAALSLLQSAGISNRQITAIGSHGQTICHSPHGAHPFTLQIGDANIITERTGITTVADFRRADMAAGGQGAPLVPAFHAALFSHAKHTRVIVNLGGIANITILAPHDPVLGFDTGPANCLLDAWVQRHLGKARDDNGAWARSGSVNQNLLARLLSDPFFAMPAPKSTGREYFNLAWLEKYLANRYSADDGENHKAPSSVFEGRLGWGNADIQATLIALTAQSIAHSIGQYAPVVNEIFLCGGGVHNQVLMDALASALSTSAVHSTAMAGLDPDFVEAAAFAWLARERLEKRPGNLPAVTGAHGLRVLGGVYLPFG